MGGLAALVPSTGITAGRAAGAVLLCGLLAGCANRPPPPDAVITGVALARERVLLPPDVVFEATLVDVTNPELPPVVLGRQRRESAGNPPYAVRIPYPTVRFGPKGKYEVQAVVTLDGRVRLATARRYSVPQDAAYRHVNLWLERAQPLSATADAAVPLTLTHWRLIEIAGERVPRPSQGTTVPYVVFQPEEAGLLRVTGSGGCNRFVADYAVSGARLRVSSLVTNITLCLKQAARETQFLELLTAAAELEQQDTQLRLKGAEGEVLLRLEADETPLR